MSRLRSVLFFAFALLMLDLAAASPVEAQGRGRGKSNHGQSVRRSAGGSHDDHGKARKHKGEDSDEDSDSDSDSDSDRDGRRGGRDSRTSSGRRDACVDVNRDGRCDYTPTTSRYPDSRYPDTRYPDTRYPDTRYPDTRYPDTRYPSRTTTNGCVDRNGDGRCDSRSGVLRRTTLPFSQVLGALLAPR